MKNKRFKALLTTLLLCMIGTMQAWATDYADVKFSGTTDISIKENISASNSEMFADSYECIEDFQQGRYFDVWLNLPSEGTFTLTFNSSYTGDIYGAKASVSLKEAPEGSYFQTNYAIGYLNIRDTEGWQFFNALQCVYIHSSGAGHVKVRIKAESRSDNGHFKNFCVTADKEYAEVDQETKNISIPRNISSSDPEMLYDSNSSELAGSLHEGQYIDVWLNIRTPGTYNLTFESALNGSASTGGTASISLIDIDGWDDRFSLLSNTIAIGSTGGGNNYDTHSITIQCVHTGKCKVIITADQSLDDIHFRNFSISAYKEYADVKDSGTTDINIMDNISTSAPGMIANNLIGNMYNGQYFDIWLNLPFAGTYDLTFNSYSRSQGGSANISLTEAADGSIVSQDAISINRNTSLWGSTQQTHSIKIYSCGAGHVKVRITAKANEIASFGDFKVKAGNPIVEKKYADVKFSGATDISIKENIYAPYSEMDVDSYECIQNFKEGEYFDVWLNLPSEGTFKLTFNSALKASGSDEGRASVSLTEAPEGSSVSAKFRFQYDYVNIGNTDGWDNFWNYHYLYIYSSGAGHVKVRIKAEESGSLSDIGHFKNFSVTLDKEYAEVNDQETTDISIPRNISPSDPEMLYDSKSSELTGSLHEGQYIDVWLNIRPGTYNLTFESALNGTSSTGGTASISLIDKDDQGRFSLLSNTIAIGNTGGGNNYDTHPITIQCKYPGKCLVRITADQSLDDIHFRNFSISVNKEYADVKDSGTTDISILDNISASNSYLLTNTYINGMQDGQYFEVLLNLPFAGTYDLTFNSGASYRGGSANISLTEAADGSIVSQDVICIEGHSTIGTSNTQTHSIKIYSTGTGHVKVRITANDDDIATFSDFSVTAGYPIVEKKYADVEISGTTDISIQDNISGSVPFLLWDDQIQDFQKDRYFDVWLNLPFAGTYKLLFKSAMKGSFMSLGRASISLTEAPGGSYVSSRSGSNNDDFYINNTYTYTNFSNIHDLYIESSGAGHVKVRIKAEKSMALDDIAHFKDFSITPERIDTTEYANVKAYGITSLNNTKNVYRHYLGGKDSYVEAWLDLPISGSYTLKFKSSQRESGTAQVTLIEAPDSSTVSRENITIGGYDMDSLIINSTTPGYVKVRFSEASGSDDFNVTAFDNFTIGSDCPEMPAAGTNTIVYMATNRLPDYDAKIGGFDRKAIKVIGDSIAEAEVVGHDFYNKVGVIKFNRPINQIHKAFVNCHNLKYVTLPDSLEIIGDYAFLGCDSLKAVEVPIMVSKIGYHAFNGCRSLESINLPKSVMAIGKQAFLDCESLKKIQCELLQPIIFKTSDKVFKGVKDCDLLVYNETRELFKKAVLWRDFGNDHIKPNGLSAPIKVPSFNNVLSFSKVYNKDGIQLDNNQLLKLDSAGFKYSKPKAIWINNTREGSIATRDTAFIYVPDNTTMTIESTQAGIPGIEVNSNQTLFIYGGENSKLIVYGGPATLGVNGSDALPFKQDFNKGLADAGTLSVGGDGGKGGVGSAPAIGGCGGVGGDGGKGGGKGQDIYYDPYWNKNSHDIGNYDRHSGYKGDDGQQGENGTAMGTVYILGPITVSCRQGEMPDSTAKGGSPYIVKNRGEEQPHRYACFHYLKLGNGGGGGAGGNGSKALYAIGSGAPGGGGGAGGGSGQASHHQWVFDEDKTHFGNGHGGEGGYYYISKSDTKKAPNGGEDTSAVTWWTEAGKGGQPGIYPASNGKIYMSDRAKLDSYTTIENKEIISMTNTPFFSYIEFDKGDLPDSLYNDSLFPTHRLFYYDMPIPEMIPLIPQAKGRKFKGFEYIFDELGKTDSTSLRKLIYDEKGVILDDVRNYRLRRFDNLKLVCKWEEKGKKKAFVGCYEQSTNDPNNYKQVSVQSAEIDGSSSASVLDSLIANIEVREGYHISEQSRKINARRARQAASSEEEEDDTEYIIYLDKDAYNLTARYHNKQDSTYVHIYDEEGNAVETLTKPVLLDQYIGVRTEFTSPEHAKGMEMTWSYEGDRMPAEDITTELILKRRNFKVNTVSDYQGTIANPCDNLDYEASYTWTMVPADGYTIDSLFAYRYDEETGMAGERVQLTCADHANHPETWTLESMPGSDIVLVQKYLVNDYKINSVSHVDAEGAAIADAASIFGMYNDKDNSYEYEKPEQLTYHVKDYVFLRGIKTSADADSYMLVPEVTDAAGNHVETFVGYDFVKYLDKDGVQCDSLAQLYYINAPASDINVKFVQAPQTYSKFSFINEKEDGEILYASINAIDRTSCLSETFTVKPYALGYLETSEEDAPYVNAGYWDAANEYHELAVHSGTYMEDGQTHYCSWIQIPTEGVKTEFGLKNTVPTDVDQIPSDDTTARGTRKILRNNRIFINANGSIYDIVGRRTK